MAITVVVGIVVFLVYMNQALFKIENWVGAVPILILLGVAFVNFLLGTVIFYQVSIKNYKPK